MENFTEHYFNLTLDLNNVSANHSANITDNTTCNDPNLVELYEEYAPSFIAISRILPPIWWIVGIIGNIIALIVWLQPKMRHSSGFYLAALAITDLVFLPLNILFEVHFTYKQNILDKPGLCQWFAISYYCVQQLSPVFVLAFTVERYVSVCHPFRMVSINQNQNKTTLLTIAILSSVIIAINTVHGYFWNTDAGNDTPECDINIVYSSPQLIKVWIYWNWVMEMLIFAAVPLTVLVLNILVIIEMKKISTLEKRNMRTNSIDRRSTTIMLLGVSFYQIFTVLPVSIVYALYFLYKEGNCMDDDAIATDPKWQAHIQYNGIKILMQNIGLSHYAANFYIYLITGKIFRKQLYEMLAVVFCNKRLKKFSKLRTSSTRTTRMSLTSHRGSIGRGRLNSCPQSPGKSDPCNELEHTNKNSMYSMAELETLDPSTHQGYSTALLPSKQISPSAQLLTCVEEADGDVENNLNKESEEDNESGPVITAEDSNDVSSDKTRN